MTSSWGLTETSPLATAAHFPIDRAGVIGVPVPGVQLKLTPVEDKLEMRVKGPNVSASLISLSVAAMCLPQLPFSAPQNKPDAQRALYAAKT